MSTAQRRIEQIRQLLKSIETGDPEGLRVVDEANYIQHNPQTHTGSEGLAQLFARLAKSNPRVHVVRAFADGEFVFGHTEYDFSTRRIGFELFRFEGEYAVEHWDNIQPRQGPNASGRSMVDGPTEASELERGEENRERVREFVQELLIGGQWKRRDEFVDAGLISHDPELEDGAHALESVVQDDVDGRKRRRYTRLHRVLAQGSFVLSICEGERGGTHSSFFDLHRLDAGRIVERWNTIESIAPRSEWKNENGKF